MEKGVPIRAITRAIAALRAINRQGSLSMMQISRAIDLPYPTACRIVQTLLQEGLIEQEPARKYYRPTAMVISLSCGFQRDNRLITLARRHITALTSRIGWPVSITVREGNQMVLRDSTHANTSLTFDQYYPGFALPILESASGKLALSHASQSERTSILESERHAEHLDRGTYMSGGIMLDSDTILKQGYALNGRNDHSFTPGKTASIAVPIFRDGEFEAALTMVFFVAAMKIQTAIERYLSDILEVASCISADLSDGNGPSVLPKGDRQRACSDAVKTSSPSKMDPRAPAPAISPSLSPR